MNGISEILPGAQQSKRRIYSLPLVEELDDWKLVINDFSDVRLPPTRLANKKPVEAEPTRQNRDRQKSTNWTKSNNSAYLAKKIALSRETHTGSAPYFECFHCGYRTAQKPTLKSHMKFHMKDKPFLCNVCGYKTADKCNFRSHLRVHEGVKRHQCPHCDYKTSSKFVLKQHVTIHTGEKLFKCDQCDLETRYWSSLQAHIRDIHEKRSKQFQCGECSFECTARHLLVNHFRIHTGERPFQCPQCEYKARINKLLLKHIRNRHPNITLARQTNNV